MKRILCVLMALALVFALCACAKNPLMQSTPSGIPADAGDTSADAPQSDLDYVTGRGKLVIGYTVYPPMNYTDDAGVFTGFDTEFAQAVCAKLGLTPEFVEIVWETKEIELNAKSLDCIWNGLTIDAKRSENMSISLPYVKNAQVIVVKADSGITSTADLIGKTVVAEIGSAGESQIIGNEEGPGEENLAQAEYIGMTKQTDCLLEVKAGTADAAVLDWTLAKTAVGEGTNYADLMMIDGLELAAEEYGIAFRKGSDITEKVNTAIRQLVEDGTLGALADKYGLSLAPSLLD